MKHILRRIAISFILLFIISVIIFTLINLQPGNPFASMVTADSDPELMNRLMEEYGLNDPVPIQFIKWLGRTIRGDLGYSIQFKVSVSSLIASRMTNSLILCASVFVLTFVLTCLISVYTARKQNGLLDRSMTMLSFASISIPSFFIALLLIKWLSFDLKLLPPSGLVTAGSKAVGWERIKDMLKHMVMPVGILTMIQTAQCVRYVRGSMIDIFHEDYIKAAETKGISETRVVWVHGFRNAVPSVITLFAMQFPNLISGTVLTETVFVWPGIGRLSYEAILSRDYPVTMGVTLVIAVLVITASLVADVLSYLLTPLERKA